MLPFGLAIAVGLSSLIFFLIAFLMPKIHRQDDFFWSGLGFFYALVLWFCAPQIKGAVLLGQLAVVALLISYSWQVIKLRKAIANPDQQQNLDKFSIMGFVGGFFNRSSKAKGVTEAGKVKAVEKLEKVEEREKVKEVERLEEGEKAEKFEEVEQVEEVKEVSETVVETEQDNVVDDIVDAVLETRETPTIETSESKDDTAISSELSNSSTEIQDVPVETETLAKSEPESTPSSNIPDTATEKKGLFNRLLKFGNKKQESSPDKTSLSTTSLTNTKLNEILDEEEEEVVVIQSEEMPQEISTANLEATEEIEEETNWDFLDEEPETTSEVTAKETTNQEEEEIQDLATESPEVTTEKTETAESEKPASEQDKSE